jgi:PAS domain S-box-containing protein
MVEYTPLWKGYTFVPEKQIKRILIVDDNEDHLYITKKNLESRNSAFSVKVVRSGEECLAALANGEFDCIISDYDMRPGMNGIDLIQTLRNRRINIPVIVISEVGDAQIEARALSTGAVDYFNKSIGFANFETVVSSINQAIEERRRQLEEPVRPEPLSPLAEAISSEPAPHHFTNSSDLGIIIESEGQTVAQANKIASQVFGKEEIELIGAPVASLIVAEDRTELRRLILQALWGLRATSVVHFIGGNGNPRPFRVVCEAKKICGKVVGAYISAREIKREAL